LKRFERIYKRTKGPDYANSAKPAFTNEEIRGTISLRYAKNDPFFDFIKIKRPPDRFNFSNWMMRSCAHKHSLQHSLRQRTTSAQPEGLLMRDLGVLARFDTHGGANIFICS
jgi:hypothetical protein